MYQQRILLGVTKRKEETKAEGKQGLGTGRKKKSWRTNSKINNKVKQEIGKLRANAGRLGEIKRKKY